MVRHVLQTHSIDPDRVYVAGLSAGGAMAAILASEYPDLFAAAGVHSGVAAGAAARRRLGVLGDEDRPGGGAAVAERRRDRAGRRPLATRSPRRRPQPAPAPVIVFHGDADATVAAANGDAVIAAALAASTPVAEKVAGDAAAGQRRARRTVWRAAGAGADAPTLAEHWVVARRAARLVGRRVGRLVHRSRRPGRVARDAALLPRPSAPARLTTLRLLRPGRAGAAIRRVARRQVAARTTP